MCCIIVKNIDLYVPFWEYIPNYQENKQIV